MAHINPPYRADHVGSFLRPSKIVNARRFFQEGKIGKAEIITGMSLGIPNYLSSLFLLKSLSSVSAYIAYPTYSVGAILVVIAASTLFFHEKLSAYSRISVLMIIAAIVMLNV